MVHWLDAQTLEECKRQIRGGVSPRSQLMREIADRLVEDQLGVLPAIAEIVSAPSLPGRTCDLLYELRERLRNRADSLRFDPEKAELIIHIQMRVVPRLLRTLDNILAEKGL